MDPVNGCVADATRGGISEDARLPYYRAKARQFTEEDRSEWKWELRQEMPK